MQIAIRSSETQQQELLQKGFNADVSIQWIGNNNKLSDANADAYFDLLFNDVNPKTNEFINGKPVFVHGVNCICKGINRSNYIRLNAWPGFLNRPVTELVCCNTEFKKIAADIFATLQWPSVFISDDYGFISARIISMIINEAYYALEENVSTKEQIDIAMKLGTNYRFGPFEWSENIGVINVFHLLKKLSAQHKRYTISQLLVYECQQF